jgi:NAD(P)-dependent dehydrogenase (short-subunit alcohol dehydrogenase family)
MSAMELTGQVALITGSGRGLGRAIAERLAELGAAVAIHDISQDASAVFGEAESLDAVAESIRRFGKPVTAVTGDIADEAAVQAMVQKVEADLGPITLLINCAGGDIGADGNKPVPNDALNIPMEDVRSMMDRNLIGTMLMCRAVCPGMRERGSGAVVNFGSTAAHFGVGNGVIYGVAKAAIVHWTRCLAQELRPYGVRVNCISPGPTMTARFLATREVDPAMADESIPLARFGLPAEQADVVAFLCSHESRYISGQVIRVDGGGQLFPA